MKLLEYQAKQRFAAAGIPVPPGRLARTPDEAAAAARELGRVAVKAQVPIGGRGKAGGIAVVDTPEEAEREAARILAMDIRGYPVRSVWCETGLSIDSELYLGITLDRDRRRRAGTDQQALARSLRGAATVRDPAAGIFGARARIGAA